MRTCSPVYIHCCGLGFFFFNNNTLVDISDINVEAFFQASHKPVCCLVPPEISSDLVNLILYIVIIFFFQIYFSFRGISKRCNKDVIQSGGSIYYLKLIGAACSFKRWLESPNRASHSFQKRVGPLALVQGLMVKYRVLAARSRLERELVMSKTLI